MVGVDGATGLPVSVGGLVFTQAAKTTLAATASDATARETGAERARRGLGFFILWVGRDTNSVPRPYAAFCAQNAAM